MNFREPHLLKGRKRTELLMDLNQVTEGQPDAMEQACMILGLNVFTMLPAPRNYRPPRQLAGQERMDMVERIKEQFGSNRPLLALLGHILHIEEITQLTAASS